MFSVTATDESPDFPTKPNEHDLNYPQQSRGQPRGDMNEAKMGEAYQDENFEEHIMEYDTNSFGHGDNQSRKYIDDMTSSSGNISGYSENADCLPIVEQIHDSKTVNRHNENKMKAGHERQLSQP